VIESNKDRRSQSLGDGRRLSMVDKFGAWLGTRHLQRRVGSWQGKRVLDVGCGFDARATRVAREQSTSVTLIDFALAPALVADPAVITHVGSFQELGDELPRGAFDVVVCLSVLEHMENDQGALNLMFELLAPEGCLILGVPTWRGRRLLELVAFRLGWADPVQVGDHLRYYDVSDLWPLLVLAGFRPDHIRCRRIKFGLNLLAICRRPISTW
jgi:SAM-dependent methyltransferase